MCLLSSSLYVLYVTLLGNYKLALEWLLLPTLLAGLTLPHAVFAYWRALAAARKRCIRICSIALALCPRVLSQAHAHRCPRAQDSVQRVEPGAGRGGAAPAGHQRRRIRICTRTRCCIVACGAARRA